MPTQSVNVPTARTSADGGLVVEVDVEPQPTSAVSIADPGPLGLAAFAMTTFVLSVFNAHIITDAALSAVVLPLALFYGGIGQFAAGMWEFRKGNTFGALAFTSYGAFWLSFAGYVKFIAPGLPTADANKATGIFLLSWLIFTVIMTLAASRVSHLVFTVFVLLSGAFLFLMLGAFNPGSVDLTKVGGIFGLATAAAAWYTVAAGITAATFGRQLLPTRIYGSFGAGS